MKKIIALLLLFLSITTLTYSQKQKKEKTHPLDDISLNGLKWRSVGPALTSGRISDIAVNPNNFSEYYVATSSGGVWKTTNSGVHYEPIFDNENSYSTGCVTIDPNNTNIIWIGTGENNHQRSVSYGDGVYKSMDAGKSWSNMGLKNSEHIGKIIVHPKNSNIIYVAAVGPLWSKGGDRGLYKSEDGGKTWNNLLSIDEHTGVTDIIMDPRNPEVLYASTVQRRRHVYTYVGGGPGSGLYKTTNGGNSWEKIQKGLPKVELGRIGLAISPADPETIYAIVEAANRKGGFYKSTNRGAFWERQSDHFTNGLYYQKIIADPIDVNTVYCMETWMTVTHDGGKTFKNVGEDFKHVDNHSIWINPNNNKHLLVGCDGGIYETFDAAKTWDFKENLPITQFYKVALDNDFPFYNIYGGTQDNFSLGGPSRVNTAHGITNQDWFITHGGDGFESQIDQENPNIVYAQSQYGWLVRYDKKSGEEVGIKPIASKGEVDYKWNWDAPLAISKHKKGRLYFSANKVFRSDDYGNSWKVISDDLSRKLDRNTLKVYDRVLSIDAINKHGSTSPYGTIVAFSESPIDANLLAIGTDDGLIQISENGGDNWRKIDNIPGAPKQSYVNSVYLSQHDFNVIYVAFNHHKYGDFKPYIFKSDDKGNTWKPIANNLPIRGSIYSIEEDHIDKNLIFCGTEFGVFFSPNRGERWKALKNGLPTIAVRDIAIQKRENDLVLGTFGRGFYVLDDYSALRNIENAKPISKASIYPIREALMWEKSMPLGLPGKAFQGDNYYTATNLDPEAIITYYYDESYKSLKEQRQKKEKKFIKSESDTPYPNYSSLYSESNEEVPQLVFTIKDASENVVKKVFKKPSKGLQRFHWNLRYEEKNPINLNSSSFYNPFAGASEGTLVNPGTYTIELGYYHKGVLTSMVSPISFTVKALDNTVMPAKDRASKVAFQRKVSTLQGKIQASQRMLSEAENKIKYIKEAIKLVEQPIDVLSSSVRNIELKIKEISIKLNGDPLKNRLDIQQLPTPSNRVRIIVNEQKYSTASPTQTHLESFDIAKEEYSPINEQIIALLKVDIKELEKQLKAIDAPYTPGRLEINH